MKRAKFKHPRDYYYDHDVARLVAVALAAGIEISHDDAKLAWEAYSDSMAAGWMMLDEEDAHNLANIMPYLEVEE